MIDEILNIGSKIIDKIFPDKKTAEEAKIKLLELQQQGAFKEINAELEQQKLFIQDRDSARIREAEIAKSGKRDMAPTFLALALTGGFFGLLALLIFVNNIDKRVMELLQIMLGSLSTGFIQVISYYFGSSSCSRKKDYVISKLQER